MPKMLRDKRPKRPTQHINRRVSQSIFRAFDYAGEIGTPLNLYVVVNLHEQPECCAGTIFEAIRHKFRDWLNYRTRQHQPVIPAYIYTMENPRGTHPHVNWVLHLPPELRSEFERKLPRWIAKAQGHCGPSDCVVQDVDPATPKSLAKYVAKGTDPAYVLHFFLSRVHAPQGEIWGKRAGISPSLGATVRRNVGFQPKRKRYGHWQPSLAA